MPLVCRIKPEIDYLCRMKQGIRKFSALRQNRLAGLLCGCLLAIACDNPVVITPSDPFLQGTGFFLWSSHLPLADKPLKVYYHIPPNPGPSMPMVFVFHGTGRNGADYRNAWIDKANEKGFMVFAPEFSEALYPGGDAYNLGNVFVDGDNPSPGTLNAEPLWTYSVVEPLFVNLKTGMASERTQYELYGHSAGAQFVHRLVLLKPEGSYGRIVVSAAGWYTVPDPQISFPYGIAQSPVENADLSPFFGRELQVLVGEADKDPNAPALRRNDIADRQGTTRLARAAYFFQRSQALAQDRGQAFRWEYQTLPGVGHDYVATSRAAADWLVD